MFLSVISRIIAQVVNAWCIPICENNEVLQNSLSQLQIMSLNNELNVNVISHKKYKTAKILNMTLVAVFPSKMYVM